MSKLLNNLPIENLTEENDYLGIIDKGQIIKTFLESNTDEFKDIKMFALYGEWGSGKSTLMKYLQKELKGNFNTFFFEAWQYESDDNLSLSLLEYLSYETSDSTDEALGEIVKVAAKLFRGFSKSMRVSIPGLSVDGSKIVESLEEEPKETFYQLKNQFQKEFKSWENINTVKGKPKFNIVFIDDLDRCEPENVLNLLSALKLFFTYGEKTIFFCGIDKKAVKEAVKTKYGEIVKANEYLEKIFDVSFSMPEDRVLTSLISLFFSKTIINEVIPTAWDNYIARFFYELKFNNPRRVKKVLNKFSILQSIKNNQRFENQIPNIYAENSGNLFETLLVIYLIILHEFYSDYFSNTFNLKHKEAVVVNAIKSRTGDNSYGNYLSTASDYINHNILNKAIKEIDFRNNGHYDNLIFTFLPESLIEMESNGYNKSFFETMKFSEITIEHRFLKFLVNRGKIFMNGKDNYSLLTLNQVKNLIKSLL